MVRKGGETVIGGDGQVSLGQTIIKGNARKVRRLGKGEVIAGFAGATADAFTLFERLESKLEQYPGSSPAPAWRWRKDWRTDRYLRRLEAMMLSPTGRPAWCSPATATCWSPRAASWASARAATTPRAARALIDQPLDAVTIVRRAMAIAGEICVYTNGNLVVERIDA